jgi:hypothetical protein
MAEEPIKAGLLIAAGLTMLADCSPTDRAHAGTTETSDAIAVTATNSAKYLKPGIPNI